MDLVYEGKCKKKQLYPTCIRAIFNAAIRKYNDYDREIIQNPFINANIPKSNCPQKRITEIEIINKLLLSQITKPVYDGICRKEFAQDVALMIFCLAGINAADLYDMKKTQLRDNWKLCYNRKKQEVKANRSLIGK